MNVFEIVDFMGDEVLNGAARIDSSDEVVARTSGVGTRLEEQVQGELV